MKTTQIRSKSSNKLQAAQSGIDWQLSAFWLIAYAIAWPIAFFYGVDEEAIRTAHSPLAAAIIIYLPKFAFTIAGVVLYWFSGQLKEMWARLTTWQVKGRWYVLAYFGPAALYLISARISASGASDCETTVR